MSAVSFKCPHCGGELKFAPATQKYECPYCGSSFSQQELEELNPATGQVYQGEEAADAGASSDSQAQGQSQSASREEAALYSCPSCGAQIVTDPTTAATFCYYCHNPVVLEGRVSGEFLPDKIIPFQLDKQAAQQKFTDFIKSKKFVPRAFYNEKQIEKLSGVYYPFWVYDTEVDGGFNAEGTKLRVWTTGNTEYTETSVFHVERAGKVRLRDMTRNALEKSDRQLVENVQPYRLEETKPFHMGYLSGFLAEKRDMEKDHFAVELRKEAQEYAQNLLKETAQGYSSLQVTSGSFRPLAEGWSYTLLPVWVLTYRDAAGEMYYYALNGQTGRAAGKLPVDKLKVFLFALGIGLIVAAIILAIGYFILFL